MIRRSFEDLFVVGDCLLELSKFYIGMADVFGNFESHFFGSTRQNIQCHFIHLNSRSVFLLMIVNISHIHPNSTSKCILFSFDNLVVFSKGLLEHSTSFEAKSMIQ